MVVKDAGDDPDVTHGAHLTARVTLRDAPGLELRGGPGVGTVTKPGLGLEVGGPAINAGPRAQIAAAVAEVFDTDEVGVVVEVSVPGGEKMARRTSNPRLGIVGGISILGTTGIVRPFSTAAWRASVGQAIDVMDAQGERTLVLTTGGRSERAARRLAPELPEVCFVEVGDFTGYALKRAVALEFERCLFVGMAGKLSKLGAGVLMTHWTRSKVDPQFLAALTAEAGGDEDVVAAVSEANSARHAYELWEAAGVDAGARPAVREGGGQPRDLRQGPDRRRRDHGRLRGRARGRREPGRARPRGCGGAGVIAVLGVDGGALPARAPSCWRTRRWSPAAGATSRRWLPRAPRQVALTGELEPRSMRSRPTTATPCVLASGDPGFYGIVRALAARGRRRARSTCGPRRRRWPSPSRASASPWDDALVVSGHGRDPARRAGGRPAPPEGRDPHRPAAPPAWYAQRLAGSGRALAVAERLGEDDERVVRGTPEELARATFAEPNVLLVLDPASAGNGRARVWPPRTPPGWALPDDAFEHRAGMVTKAEVRALALARLGPGTGDLVWDVGCGSGSVAIECARLGAAAIGDRQGPRRRSRSTQRNAAAHGVPRPGRRGRGARGAGRAPRPGCAPSSAAAEPTSTRSSTLCCARARRAVVVDAGHRRARRARAASACTRPDSRPRRRWCRPAACAPLAGGHRLAAENPVVVVSGARR